jgi:hypothetical protein
MNCDHYHVMSERHKICQDYTTTGVTADGICAVLSDGCSSAPDTDIGARIMAHQFRQKLPAHWGSDYGLATLAGFAAADMSKAMGLSQESNYATVGYIYSNGKIIKTALFGDGVVYIRDKNDNESVFWVHFVDNTPYYPYYVHSTAINPAYFEGKHGRYTVCSVTNDMVECVSDDVVTQIIPTTFMGIYPANSIKVLAVFSDGIDSFSRQGQDSTIMQMVNEFTDFKNYGGEFVRRRCTSVFRQNPELSWTDDFSMIALANV